MHEIADDLKVVTTDRLAAELNRVARLEYEKATREARAQVEAAFLADTKGLTIVSGKEVLGRMAEWAKQYGVSVGVAAIIRAMRPEEVHPEVRSLVEQIYSGRPFPKTQWSRET